MSPKHKQQTLWVKAVSIVRHIDTATGTPLKEMRFVGRDAKHDVLQEGEKISYHSFYINELKQGALLPMDLVTAALAGVPFRAL